MRYIGCSLLMVACASAHRSPPPPPSPLPSVPVLYEHHAHLFSPAASLLLQQQLGRSDIPPFTVDDLKKDLDAGHVQKAALLSVAYFFAKAGPNTPEDTKKMQDENDWVAAEARKYPDRLVPFFSVNPLADNAIGEIDRCAKAGSFAGLKLQLANSNVDLRDPSHIEKLQQIFATINKLHLAVIVHMRTMRPDFGRADAEAFIG